MFLIYYKSKNYLFSICLFLFVLLNFNRKEDRKDSMLTNYDVWKAIFSENDITEIEDLLNFILDDRKSSIYIANEIMKLKKKSNIYNITISLKDVSNDFPLEQFENEVVQKIMNNLS